MFVISMACRDGRKSEVHFPPVGAFQSETPKLNHVGRGTFVSVALSPLAIDPQIGAVIRGDIWWIIPRFERHQKRSRVYDTRLCAWLS
jgi:hypothetical protein